MNRCCHLLLAVALAVASLGPALAIGDLDGAGRKLVKHVWYFPSKRPQRVATGYLGADGKLVLHGFEVTYYDLPGNVKSSGTSYEEGLKHGKHVSWYANGKDRERGSFERGQRTGTWTLFYESGDRHQEALYLNDQLEGPFKAWYEGGQLQAERTYVRNRRQGQETRYHPNGAVQSRVYWVDDLMQGAARSFYPDGKPKQEVSFAAGKKTGELKEFYPDGKLRLLATYLDDLLNGPYEARTPDGSLVGKGIFREGRIEDGNFREAGLTPNQFWVNSYEKGQVVDGTLFEDGQPKSGEVKEFYPNGSPLRLYFFIDGKRNDKEIWWHPNGQVQREMKWKDNRLDGVFSEFWPDGSPKWIATFDNGRRVGIETRWDHRGGVLSRGEYKDGQPWEGTFVVPVGDEEILKIFANGVMVGNADGTPSITDPNHMRLTSEPKLEPDGQARRWKVNQLRILTPEEMATEEAKKLSTPPIQPSDIQ